MTGPYFMIERLARKLTTGNTEELVFDAGVNLLVGPPNTGKTKWLQTLDYLLGDTGDNPFEGAEEAGLADKYEAASVSISIGDHTFHVERRWREPGSKGKIFVDEAAMSASEFQHWLMDRLGIPILHFPKGNPMSGQTWPELSFRMLLRHIYRQQRFWSGIADKQPEGEQHACLLQFLGSAERVFTDDYGNLVKLKLEVERLKARREQFSDTLASVARDLLADPDMTVGVTVGAITAAQSRLTMEVQALRARREVILTGARDLVAGSPERSGHIAELGQKRAIALVQLEEYGQKRKATVGRISELQGYRSELTDELERLSRAEDAGAVLADLRVTHCPACDQTIAAHAADLDHCFLCHQHLPDGPAIEELGVVRLQFERNRITGELKEINELLEVLERESEKLRAEGVAAEEIVRSAESELEPARSAVASLVQEEVSSIDVALGQASERERQVGRVAAALEIGEGMTLKVAELEKKIEPLERRVDEISRSIDFDAAAGHLEDGMNQYLSAINKQRPDVWRHNKVTVILSRWSFTIRVGSRAWHVALGGTDTLYFLMAYHYGLLTLSQRAGCHYPGLSIIDVPGEFSGEAVGDKENFIVQPFIDLLKKKEFAGAQVIITGASFEGLKHAKFQKLRDVHVAR
jgi:hypothetical protein